MFMLISGMPKMIFLIEYAGENAKEVELKAEEALAIGKRFGSRGRIAKTKAQAEKYWSMRRDSFALLRKHSGSMRTVPFVDDFIVLPKYMPEFLPKVNAIMAEHKEMIYTIAGHAGNGNFHIIPLMDTTNPKTAEIINTVSKQIYDLVLSYGGSITAEHNDGIIRTPFLLQQFGKDVISIFGKIKKSFDSQNIFNPGKKVGGTFEDIDKYLIRGEHNITHGS